MAARPEATAYACQVTYRHHPYWMERGWLTGELCVLVVRYGAKYDATNRLTLPADEVRRRYHVRAHIEEVIRVCQDQLGLGTFALALPQPTQAHGGQQLQRLGLLLTGDVEGLTEEGFRLRSSGTACCRKSSPLSRYSSAS
jgi:hypothetical protein